MPFAPNRVVDTVIRTFLDKLATAEDQDSASTGACRLEQWAEGGQLRYEWIERDR